MPHVFALGIHADYRCGHSGACCTSDWPIAVEPAAEARILAALGDGRLGLSRTAAGRRLLVTELLKPAGGPLPDGAACLLGRDERGRCLFFEPAGRLCAIHREVGPETLPQACRQFPRLAVLHPGGVALSLSHYCPTAARLLFRRDARLDVVEAPPAFAAGAGYEGLDGRGGLPPLLRPGLLSTWDAHGLWERHLVATCAREDLSPEGVLRVLLASAEAARAWEPAGMPLAAWLRSATGTLRPDPEPGRALDPPSARQMFDAVVACVPGPVETHAELRAGGIEASAWPRECWRPVRRYLAARAFASWPALLGHGLRTSVAALAGVLAVLSRQVARTDARAGAPPSARLLEAIRASDLVLVHLAAPEALARLFSRVEDDPAPLRQVLGVG